MAGYPKARMVVKIFLSVATLSFSLKASASNFCDVYGKDPVAHLQSRAEYGDITEYAEIADLQCPNLTVKKLISSKTMSSTDWNSIVRQGYINQINYHSSRAMSYAEYGKADNEDFEQLKKYGNLLDKLDKSEIKSAKRDIHNNLNDQNRFIHEMTKINKSHSNNNKSCEFKNFTKMFGRVRDQTNMDWCYSFVAADLLSTKTKTPISAASLSALYGKFINRGHGTQARGKPSEIISKTIELAEKNGACSESDFPSEFKNGGASYVENLRAFMKTKEVNRNSTKPPSKLEAKGCHSSSLLNTAQKNNHSDLQQIRENMFNDHELQAFESRACDKKRIKSPPVTIVAVPNQGSPTYLIDEMDKLIDNDKPLGINYYSGFLKETTATQMEAHASIIVGRELDAVTGKCEYLIRNSWGKDCKKMPGIPPEKCKNGYFLVPREELHRHIIDAVYLK